MLHLSRGEVDESPLHTILLCVVEVGMWSSHYNVASYPSIGMGLKNMYVTFLGNNGAAEFKKRKETVLTSVVCFFHSVNVDSPDSDLLDIWEKSSRARADFNHGLSLSLLWRV